MATPTSIKELFASLGERLSEYYESKSYVQQTTTEYCYHYERDEEIEQYDSGHGIMNDISKNANFFDGGEVYQEADNYKSRVKSILENLEPTINERIVHENSDSDYVQLVTDDRKDVLLARHREELEYIINGLDTIMNVRENSKVTNVKSIEKAISTPSEEIVINLPEGFTVKQLVRDFKPVLKLKQAALFLYYLRDLELIPKYSDSSIGKLAEALFARNQKNITTELTEIHTAKQNKEDLIVLKKELLKVLELLESDLKRAR